MLKSFNSNRLRNAESNKRIKIRDHERKRKLRKNKFRPFCKPNRLFKANNNYFEISGKLKAKKYVFPSTNKSRNFRIFKK